MTWFKVDDKLHDHRKARAAGKAAMGVWALAGSWSADHLTDGFVPASVLPRWGTRADAAKLVTAGLWDVAEQDGEKGWRFHDWGVHQPDAASVKAKQQAESEAGALGNHKRWHVNRKITVPDCSFCQGADQVPDRSSDSGANPPSRPVPSPAAAARGIALPTSVEILRSALEARKLTVRWDTLTQAEVNEIAALVEVHGDGPLVKDALRQFQPNKPAATAKAWLGGWRDLRQPGDLAAVSEPCPEPGHTDTTRPCRQCASERLARSS